MTHKVFVNTSYSGENEFDKCCEMVKRQQGVIVEHHIVKNKPILDAFDDMYQTWESRKHEFDVMVQLDADMIMTQDNVLKHYIDRMDSFLGCNHMFFPVYDFYTDSNMWGLHFYKPSIRFVKLKNKYACDTEFDRSNRVMQIANKNERALVHHGSMPTVKTAFHFGWHRQLRIPVRGGQAAHIRSVKTAYARTKDIMRGHAVAGALAAEKYYKETKDITPIEYTSDIFQQHLEKYLQELKNDQ